MIQIIIPDKIMKFAMSLSFIIYRLTMNDQNELKSTVFQLRAFIFLTILMVFVLVRISLYRDIMACLELRNTCNNNSNFCYV